MTRPKARASPAGDAAGLELRAGLPEPGTSLLFDVFALGQAVRQLLEAAMAGGPLSPTDYALYSAIFELESPTPTQLARRLGMPLTTVMDVIARLERAGSARRMRDAHDRRATRVVLTADGLAAHRAANRLFERAYASIAEYLGPDEQAVRAGLDGLRRAVDAAHRSRPDAVTRGRARGSNG
jgi:MarR family transcriptional regulator, negative regulator of the multidrug operon emrRAB